MSVDNLSGAAASGIDSADLATDTLPMEGEEPAEDAGTRSEVPASGAARSEGAPGLFEQKLTETLAEGIAFRAQALGVPHNQLEAQAALAAASAQEVMALHAAIDGKDELSAAVREAVRHGTLEDDLAAARLLAASKLTLAEQRLVQGDNPQLATALGRQLLAMDLVEVAGSNMAPSHRLRIEQLLIDTGFTASLGAALPVLAELIEMADLSPLSEDAKRQLEEAVASSPYARSRDALQPGTVTFLQNFLGVLKAGESSKNATVLRQSMMTAFMTAHGEAKPLGTDAEVDNEIGLALGMTPDNKPKRRDQAALAKGQFELFSGKQLEAIQRIATGIYKSAYRVGMADAKVSAALVLIEHRSEDPRHQHRLGPPPIVREPTVLWRVSGKDGTSAYIDTEGRIYADIKDYIDHAHLPEGKIIVPHDGQLSITPDGKVALDRFDHVKSGWETARDASVIVLDAAAILGATALTAASFFDLGLSAPLAALAWAAVLGSTAVAVGSSVGDLRDRDAHGQSVAFNGETALDYLTLASAALGPIGIGAPRALGLAAARELLSLNTAVRTARVISTGAAAVNWGTALYATADLQQNWDHLAFWDKALGVGRTAVALFDGAATTAHAMKGRGIVQRAGIDTEAAYLASRLQSANAAEHRGAGAAGDTKPPPEMPASAPTQPAPHDRTNIYTRLGRAWFKRRAARIGLGEKLGDLPPPSAAVANYFGALDEKLARAPSVHEGEAPAVVAGASAEADPVAPSSSGGAVEPNAEVDPVAPSSSADAVEAKAEAKPAPPSHLSGMAGRAGMLAALGGGLGLAENSSLADVARYGGPFAYILRGMIQGGSALYTKWLGANLAEIFDRGGVKPEAIDWYFDRVKKLGSQYNLDRGEIEKCESLTREFQADVKALLEEPLRAPIETEADRQKEIIAITTRYIGELDDRLGFSTRGLSAVDPRSEFGRILRIINAMTLVTNFVPNLNLALSSAGALDRTQGALFASAYTLFFLHDALMFASSRFGPRLATEKLPAARWVPILALHLFTGAAALYTAHDFAAGRNLGALIDPPLIVGAAINGWNAARAELGHGARPETTLRATTAIATALVVRMVLQLAWYNNHGKDFSGLERQPAPKVSLAQSKELKALLGDLMVVTAPHALRVHADSSATAPTMGLLRDGALVKPTGTAPVKDELGHSWREVQGYDAEGHWLRGWVDESYIRAAGT